MKGRLIGIVGNISVRYRTMKQSVRLILRLGFVLICFSVLQYTVFFWSLEVKYREPGMVFEERKLQIKSRRAGESDSKDYCGRNISCDAYIICAVETWNLDEGKGNEAVEVWNKYRKLTCADGSKNYADEGSYCKYVLETAEVQLGFLKAGIQPFPASYVAVGNNVTNISYVSTNGCQNTSDFIVPVDERQNNLTACLGKFLGINYIAIDLRSDNESFPDATDSYRFPGNHSVPKFEKWGNLTNGTDGNGTMQDGSFLCAAVDTNTTLWINVDCESSFRMLCSWNITQSQVVATMKFANFDQGDVSTANLQKVEASIEQASSNPILATGDVLDLGVVQFTAKQAENVGGNFSIKDLKLNVANVSYVLDTNGTNKIASSVVSFERFTRSPIQNRSVPNGSLATSRYLPPDTVAVVAVSGWDQSTGKARNALGKTLQGQACIQFHDVTAINECGSLRNATVENHKITECEDSCLYLDKNIFFNYGCTTIQTGNDTKCCCKHTTMFTVLLAVTTVQVPNQVKILSYVTESISVVFLFATIGILVRYKSCIKGDGLPIQINLSIVLIFLHVLNLLHDAAVKNDYTCVALTIGIHFFFLASGSWMLVEGFRIFMVTLDPVSYNSQNPRKRFRLFLLFGYSLPLLLVSVGVGVGMVNSTYMKPQAYYIRCNRYRNQTDQIQKYDRCWIAAGSPIFYGTVLAPLACIIVFNVGVAIHTSLAFVNSKRPSKKNQGHSFQDLAKGARSLVFLFFMLGGTLTLAFFTGVGDYTSQQVFMYINAVVNGSQGFVVFLLFCVMNEAIRSRILPKRRQNPVSFSSESKKNKKRKAKNTKPIRETSSGFSLATGYTS